MKPPSRRCGAKTRGGWACRRAPSRGRERCKLHGGASRGPVTPEGIAAAQTSRLDHGAYARLTTFQRGLAVVNPEMFEAADASTKLDDEIRFARAKLATVVRSAVESGRDLTEATAAVLAEIRLLVQTKAAIHPGAEASGKFEITFRVEGQDPPADAEPDEEPS